MAKRFTDSEKFRDNWYRKLKPKHKCLWEYMLSECSIAGILEFDFDIMSLYIGEKITQSDLELFSDKLVYLTEDKIFIPNFIKFQQKELNPSNPAHKNIILELEKYDIPITLENIDLQSPSKGASKGLQSPISNSIGNSNSISNSKEVITKNKKIINEFENFWKECPRKIGKGKAREKYIMARKNESHEFLVEMMKIHAKDMKGKEDQFIPHPATWLHQERYHDETKTTVIVQEKKEWPQWKIKIAAMLGDHVVQGWFNTAELSKDVISFGKKFEFNHVKEHYTVSLAKVGINEIILRGDN